MIFPYYVMREVSRSPLTNKKSQHHFTHHGFQERGIFSICPLLKFPISAHSVKEVAVVDFDPVEEQEVLAAMAHPPKIAWCKAQITTPACHD